MSASGSNSLALIVGAGDGLGLSIANCLSDAGFSIFGFNRSPDNDFSQKYPSLQIDVADRKQITESMKMVVQDHGYPHVLIHNTAHFLEKPFLETDNEDFETAWHTMVLSAVNVIQITLPLMLKQGAGTILVSGATGSIKAGANFSAFCSAKFALRGLTQSIAREYQSKGVHVVHITLDGILNTKKSKSIHKLDDAKMMSTIDIAEVYLQLIKQKSSTWTHELDLRNKLEKF